mmetsp:Transcript_4223/g.8695  ORF Transcript_4223/g.8695 Transcript_4223/m.8695 type:complete len:118 (+) Transcript_4223:3354-3707(+)
MLGSVGTHKPLFRQLKRHEMLISHNSKRNLVLSMPVPIAEACSSTAPDNKSSRKESRSTEADMLSGISQERNARSRGHWFTEFCNSQRLSHFAAPFIGARAKISVAENCNQIILDTS